MQPRHRSVRAPPGPARARPAGTARSRGGRASPGSRPFQLCHQGEQHASPPRGTANWPPSGRPWRSCPKPWERTAGVEELGVVAEAADRLGFHHLTCSKHVAVPMDIAEQRGGTYWDPLATFGYLAARTGRIRFATQVLVLGHHHPSAVAKRYGTLDRVSGRRLVLGLGVGSLEEEYRLLGAAFENRGVVADDALAALRVSLPRREPAHHGEHFDYEGFVVEPHAVQDRVPLWIGGRTSRSLRRAVPFGDGWVPFGLSLDRLRELVDAASLRRGGSRCATR
ncbi:TIGR03619 family F420-dependent LLM class oxidoreductase [Streptomyces sp. NPDC093149]|uniref:TIGR03619 family F420-dependent LLM class oxidoreductase n=1 Tax=Streptomyces sp. NPDC093149 TaxID=3366031 RepID=UPI0038214E70